jgi:signal peptidase I
MSNTPFDNGKPQGFAESDDILDVSVLEWSRTRQQAAQQPPAPEPEMPPQPEPIRHTAIPELVSSRAVAAAPASPAVAEAPFPAPEAPAAPAYTPENLTPPIPEEEGEARQDGPNWFVLLLRETAETVILAVIIFMLIRVGIQNYRIEGNSMAPNFQNGEYLLVNKLAYRLGEYHRGDVIVFQYPNDPSKDYIKRVIGLPGDTVEIRERTLYINGSPVDEPYEIMSMSSIPAGPTLVDPGTLYVMGDNRPASSDTRDWGLLDQDLVIGKAWLAIYPFQIFGLVEHPDLQLTNEMAQGP